MQKINHFRCYFAGEIQQPQLHLIMNSSKPCVIVELGWITWPNNFVVRKLHDSLSYSTTSSPRAVSNLWSRQTPILATFFISLPTWKISGSPGLRNMAFFKSYSSKNYCIVANILRWKKMALWENPNWCKSRYFGYCHEIIPIGTVLAKEGP